MDITQPMPNFNEINADLESKKEVFLNNSNTADKKKRKFILIGLILVFVTLLTTFFFISKFDLIKKEEFKTQLKTSIISPTIQLKPRIEKIVVPKKESNYLYVDIKNQLIKIFKEQ